MKNENIVRVAFYIRVSTIEQTKGFGPDYQLNALNDLIKYKSNQSPQWIHNKKWHYEDGGYSGGDLQRPGYKQMIEDAKNGEFDMIAVWKIDRMSRNLSHLLKTFEDLKQYGVGFYSVKENIDFSGPIGKLTFQIFGALAEFEREMIKSRTLEGKIASAKIGNYIQGAAPYGYSKVKNKDGKGSKLEIIKNEIDIVKKIFEWFIYDGLSYSDIMRKLNDMKIKKGEGGVRKNIEYTKWYETTVKDVLIRTEYVGYVEEKFKKDGESNSVIIPTPKIISKNLFDLAQVKIKEIEEQKRGGKRKYLLSGKIFDEVELTDRGEMRKFVGVNRTKGGHSYRREGFINSRGEKIENKEFPGKTLDTYVWSIIEDFINQPDNFFKLYKKQTTELNNIDRFREEIEILNIKIDEEELKKDNIERKEISGRLSEEKADKYILECNKNIQNFQKEVLKLNEKIESLLNLEFSQEVIKKVSKDFLGKINNLNDEQKRMLVDILVDKVLVSEDENKNLRIRVIFRFNVDDTDSNDDNLEPNYGISKIKNTITGALNYVYGTPSRIRTHGRPRFAA